MIQILVTDASVIVDLLGRFEPAPIKAILFAHGVRLVAPELLDIEVLQALRLLEIQGVIPEARIGTLLDEFSALRIRKDSHRSVLDEVWKLRDNLSAYDAAYVALARRLDAPLVTRDKRLANSPSLNLRIETP